MKMSRFSWALVAIALTICGGVIPAAAEDGAVVEDILQVLREREIIDDEEYQRMASKNAKYEAERNSWVPEIDWSGDFRFRHESWWYEGDETGFDRDNRYRIRYRFRLKGEISINDYADVIFRLVSGGDDNRSNNQTLGSSVDFDTDDIRLNLVYARLTAPESWFPLPGGTAVVEMGKVSIPFIWKRSGMKKGKDFMLWDADIAPEGVSLLLSAKPAERTRIFATFGYYVIDENSQARDPHFWGIQGGAHQDLSEDLVFGARASWYEFRSIDAAFNARGAFGTAAGGVTSGGGNILDGLNDNIDGRPFSVAEAGAYFTYSGLESWPITVYGTYARNLDAKTSRLTGAGAEDTAWGAGVEVGDSKRYAKLGVGYWHIEANSFPSMFIDSDFLDGRTNREGYAFYGSRQILANTELKVTLFVSDEIQDDAPFLTSVRNAERMRLQSDIVFKF
jgi:hypothetical protein